LQKTTLILFFYSTYFRSCRGCLQKSNQLKCYNLFNTIN